MNPGISSIGFMLTKGFDGAIIISSALKSAFFASLVIITNIFSKNKVSIKRLIQNPKRNKGRSSIVIITHASKDKNFTKIIKFISKKNYVKASPKFIRIDDN